ncbi:MAG TPA: oligosaccharide flippase family protein [Smithella sp.]|nr:oligosaccharide flippase family protein [Smithella sp.]
MANETSTGITNLVFKRFITNSSYQLLSSMVATTVALVQAIVLGRYLGVFNYGILALLTTYALFVDQFVSCNMWEFVIKYGTDYLANNERNKYLATVKLGYMLDAASGMAALLIIVIAAKSVATYIFHSPAMAAYAGLYSLIILCSFVDNTSNGVLRIHGRFGFISLRDTTLAVSRLALVWMMLMLGHGLNGVIAAMLIISFIQMIINLMITFKQLECSPIALLRGADLGLLKNQRKEMKAFLANNYLTQCWAMVIANADMIILGYYSSPIQAGLYRMGKNFVNILARVVDPFYTVIYPDLVSARAKMNYENFLSLIKKGTAAVAMLVTPLTVVILIAVPFILKFAVGENFIGAAAPARLLVSGAWFAALFFWTRPALLAMGKARTQTVVNFFIMLIYIIAYLIIIPQYGIIGAAGVYCAVLMLGYIMAAYFVQRHFRSSFV